MSTTTPSPDKTQASANEGTIASTARSTVQGWLLILLVFVAGACSLAVELSASRLLAPYFGTSLFVWANLIGLILLYLTIGYYLGGRLADRFPRPAVLYSLTITASFLIGLIPFISRPILLWSQSSFATYSIGVFYGSLVSVILLFAIPMILLGCVSPFAIRLRIEQIGKSGRTAGQLYAISTAGSILGTFLPVLWLIPAIGTYRTFFTFAVCLLLISIIALTTTRMSHHPGPVEFLRRGRGKPPHPASTPPPPLLDEGVSQNLPPGPVEFLQRGRGKPPHPTSTPPPPLLDEAGSQNLPLRGDGQPRPRGRRIDKSLLSILLLIPMALSIVAIRGPIKPADGSNGGGDLLTERESVYNYIQVVQVGDETQLVLNEGVGIHSIYNPHELLTQGPWDYFMVAPYFNNPPFTQQQVRRVGIIGLGAGTAVREFSAAYGPIPIDGVEIDGTIVDLARQYFHMNEPNLNVIVQDGRYFLQTTSQKYDVIGIDAYQQPYVPFQLTTREFFQEVRDHLTPTGVTVINAGRTNRDFRLVEALAQTMHSVFPNVYIIDTQRFTNSLVIGTNAPTSLINFKINSANISNPLLDSVAQASLAYGNMREERSRTAYFTDDRAPVEQLIDQIIFDAVQNKGQ